MAPLILFEDTRQQKGKHQNIAQYCDQNGILLIRTMLYVGDYQIAGRGGVSVDTKLGVSELAMNMYQEHDRFREECENAQRCGISLIVLVEEELPGGRLDDWRSPIGWDGLPMWKFDPEKLRKAMYRMQERYQVRFRFCSRQETGRRLVEYLTGVRT